ncbi:transporter substrate-binding domain-containing protein, partial [Sulfurimonas sp. MAG313]
MKIFMILLWTALILNAREIVLNADEGNMVQSTNAEILKRAYASLGIDLKIVSHSLSKSLMLSNSGQLDGEPGRIKKISKKFPNLVRVPVPINYVEAIAFGKDNEVMIKKWQDLKAYKIGVIKGVKFIEGPTKKMNKVSYNSFKEAFKALDDGLIEIVVAPKVTGKFIIETQGYKDIYKVSRSLKRLHLYHFLHK